MITIYHNPRCGKSREGLALVEESGIPFKVVRYMDTPLSPAELSAVLSKLDYKPSDLLRKGEAVWKELSAQKQYTEDEILNLMLEHPRLMERPVVVLGDRAVVGRPPERIREFLSE